MATLIQSKQIEGVVTASVIEGVFTVSGSFIATGSDSIFSSITASSISSSGPIYGVRYADVDGTPSFIGGTGITITQVGDVYTITNTITDTTGSDSQILSIVGDQITISNGNTITIPTGSGVSSWSEINNIPSGLVSGSSQVISIITSLNDFTSSYYLDSASFDSRILGIVSGGSGADWNLSLQNIPSGLVSSSDQVLGGTGILSGSRTDISSLNDYTSSTDSRLSQLESFTSSLDATYATDSDLTSLSASIATELDNIQHTQIPDGTISSSQQISDLGFISSSHTDISSLNDFTSSIQTQVDGLSAQTSSYLTSSGSVDYSDITNIPSEIVSGSVLRTLDGTDVISGSILPGTNITIDSSSGDYIISSTGGGSVPSGTISSSQQISDLGFVTSSNEAPFDGNRVVSNTLLGDLYTNNYNAGTSGSLTDFINEVFFPSAAPTATFTEQTAKFNTNLATDGTNLNSVSITDTVDDSPYTLTLSGTDASSFTAVPTNADSSSWEIRANGDLTAGTYSYNVVVGDKNSATTTYSGKSITIAQADNGTLATNGTLYIIESATSGVITLSSTGRPGSTGVVSVSYSPNYGTQVATNFSSSNPLISVNSTNGQLSVGSPISGSGNLAGSTITSTISWEDQYGNTDSANISVNVTTNFSPTRSATTTTNNNTNQATGSAQIIRLVVTDTESDSIPNSGLVWGNYNSTYFSASVSSPYLYLHANNTSIPAGVYPYTASFSDVHGFRTSSYSSSVTINQAVVGTLGGDTTSYIIESAESGDSLRDVTGFNAGNASQLTVSYSPNYGSQAVQSFTSSNPSILVSNNGLLTLGVDLSGSVTQSGDTISTNITFEDQYGNVGSGSVTVNVFANNAPTITFVSSSNYDDTTAISGSDAGTITISDTESNTPFQVSLGGTDGGKFDISGSNSPYKVQPTGSLEVGTYTISITATDDYGKTTTVTNKNIIVDSSETFPPVYIYTSTRTGGGTLSSVNYLSIQGASAVNSDVPPLVTSFTADTTSPFYLLKGGSIGNSSISVGGGTMTLRNTVSGSDLGTIVSESFDGSNGTETFMIIFPSGSAMVGTPTSMTDSLGGSTSGEYVMYIKTAGESSFNVGASTIHALSLDSSYEGYNKWNIIGRTGTHATTAYEIKLVPSSGSAP